MVADTNVDVLSVLGQVVLHDYMFTVSEGWGPAEPSRYWSWGPAAGTWSKRTVFVNFQARIIAGQDQRLSVERSLLDYDPVKNTERFTVEAFNAGTSIIFEFNAYMQETVPASQLAAAPDGKDVTERDKAAFAIYTDAGDIVAIVIGSRGAPRVTTRNRGENVSEIELPSELVYLMDVVGQTPADEDSVRRRAAALKGYRIVDGAMVSRS